MMYELLCGQPPFGMASSLDNLKSMVKSFQGFGYAADYVQDHGVSRTIVKVTLSRLHSHQPMYQSQYAPKMS